MDQAPKGHSLKGLVATSVAAVMALVIGLPLLAARVDSQSSDLERQTAEVGLRHETRYLMQRVESGAIWDSTLEHTDGQLDSGWLQANVVATLPSDVTNQIVYVLSSTDTPMFAREKTRVVPPERDAAIRHAIAPLIEDIRRQETARGRPRPAMGANPSSGWINGSATVLIDRRPYIVLAGLVQSDSGRVGLRNPHPPILLLAWDFKATVVPGVSETLLRPASAIVLGSASATNTDGAVLPLKDVDGKAVATLTGRPERRASTCSTPRRCRSSRSLVACCWVSSSPIAGTVAARWRCWPAKRAPITSPPTTS